MSIHPHSMYAIILYAIVLNSMETDFGLGGGFPRYSVSLHKRLLANHNFAKNSRKGMIDYIQPTISK